MIFDKTEEGYLLRVRLSPNSSSCDIKGVFKTPEGDKFLKVNVVSVPEKGKANKELIKFLSDILGIAKSELEIVWGDLDRYKKIFIKTNKDIVEALKKMQIDGEE